MKITVARIGYVDDLPDAVSSMQSDDAFANIEGYQSLAKRH